MIKVKNKNGFGSILRTNGYEIKELKGITDLNSVPDGIHIGTLDINGVANVPKNGWCFAILFEGSMMKRQIIIMHGREEIYTRFGTQNVWGDWKQVRITLGRESQ